MTFLGIVAAVVVGVLIAQFVTKFFQKKSYNSPFNKKIGIKFEDHPMNKRLMEVTKEAERNLQQ